VGRIGTLSSLSRKQGFGKLQRITIRHKCATPKTTKGSKAAYRSVHLLGEVKVIAKYIKHDEEQREIAEECVGNLAEREHFVDLDVDVFAVCIWKLERRSRFTYSVCSSVDDLREITAGKIFRTCAANVCTASLFRIIMNILGRT